MKSHVEMIRKSVGRPAGTLRPSELSEKKLVAMSLHQAAIANRLGSGNISLGLRRALEIVEKLDKEKAEQ
ncbi:hypothetical protein [Actimicrobium sp. CCI2.3]|jgi:hypothetical protein|uniref:hypothetical protein n=1 Tax=Actimicrobium sp. CCI2.3 TaxID=3048616 RepID=UPI002B254272|nr:hypothetical protein [Actimicrobium sp. CCI2.3]MEB0023795.1 hypothetical protein [Actimicrobium sp. CCI2.3]